MRLFNTLDRADSVGNSHINAVIFLLLFFCHRHNTPESMRSRWNKDKRMGESMTRREQEEPER